MSETLSEKEEGLLQAARKGDLMLVQVSDNQEKQTVPTRICKLKKPLGGCCYLLCIFDLFVVAWPIPSSISSMTSRLE